MKSIVAVVVLYKMSPEQSPACRFLIDALRQNARFADAFDLLVADNSPTPHTPDGQFPGLYMHDARNPGLAARYNEALARCAVTGAPWLLLLDQDTELTTGYLDELLDLASTLAPNHEIAAAVPKLLMDGRILSPHPPRYRRAHFQVLPHTTGLLGAAGDPLRAFNSAALLRVSALQSIGGFPARYPLDYLDHATFHLLQQKGYRIFVMHATLQHALHDAAVGAAPSHERLQGHLQAENRFFLEFGSPWEKSLHRLDLLRQVLGYGRRGQFHSAGLRLNLLLGRL